MDAGFMVGGNALQGDREIVGQLDCQTHRQEDFHFYCAAYVDQNVDASNEKGSHSPGKEIASADEHPAGVGPGGGVRHESGDQAARRPSQ